MKPSWNRLCYFVRFFLIPLNMALKKGTINVLSINRGYFCHSQHTWYQLSYWYYQPMPIRTCVIIIWIKVCSFYQLSIFKCVLRPTIMKKTSDNTTSWEKYTSLVVTTKDANQAHSHTHTHTHVTTSKYLKPMFSTHLVIQHVKDIFSINNVE